ncbi:hypothetical protein QKU58_gp127 [Pyramimonas orientalis virus]|uniref:Uncharacterized protein n=1 Tax=Pyramimonas orientalis virus 01B TaxID=3134525 RepID=A0A7M3UNF3_9VIRU|nr:hypothetical protein QKU58_gp127 [Pyramimonas orientalis virus]QOI90204.1 hypothetical protein HWQ62_00067 [Pyramimonas orientalis virus]
MDFKLSYIIYGIVGIIIDYITISYGVPLAFPNTNQFNTIKDKLNVSKVSVPLVLGSCSFDSSTVEINTSNPYINNYIYMPHSNNIKGGSQFSYTFWLDIKSNYSAKMKDRVIFMRGNKDVKKGLFFDKSTPLDKSENPYPLVACPLVKFGKKHNLNDKGPLLEIVFNTMKDPYTKVTLDEEVYQLITSSNTNKKWFLISIVFQDYVDFSNAEKGIQIQNFVNDNLVSTKVIKNDSLKLNNCNTYITPSFSTDTESGESYFADLIYHNFALDILDIEKVYNYGVSSSSSGCRTAIQNTNNAPLDLYNKLSMNNYL